MRTIVSIGRNDPCPCESGKKYKKCCMHEVEAAAMTLSRLVQPPEDFLFPQLPLVIDALALAAGMAPAEGFVRPDPHLLGTATNKMLTATTDKNKIETVFDQLLELFEHNSFGRHIRFDADQVYAVLDSFPALTDEEAAANMDEEQIDDMLNTATGDLVTEDTRAEVIWQLITFLQEPDLKEVDYLPIIWALFLALDHEYKVDNPLWLAMFQLSCSDLDTAHKQLRQLMDEHVPDNSHFTQEQWEAYFDAMTEFLDNNPLMAQELSRQTHEDNTLALRAIIDHQLLSFPPYTVVNGLREYYRTLLNSVTMGKKQDAQQKLNDYFQAFFDTDIPEEDFVMFATTVADSIWQWVEQHPDEDADLRQSLESLAPSVAMDFLDSGIQARSTLYLYTMMCLDPQEATELLSPDGLEQYAQELEEQDNQAAADHVRAARQRLEDSPVVWPQ